jgi:hypothetical protein
MNANYRIVKIRKKYFPQTRFQHVVTVGNGDIRPIHSWIYFKDPRGDDMWFNTYEEALNACIEDEKTEKIDEITEIEINHGKVIEDKKIR